MDYEKISDNIPYAAIVFGGLIAVGVCVGLIALALFLGLRIGGKTNKKSVILCLVPTVAVYFVSVAGFVMNLGLHRLLMFFVLLPLWYPLLLLMSSAASASSIGSSVLLKITYVLSHICYVASGLVMPDIGNVGPGFVFFGLITDYPDWLSRIADILFTVSIVSMSSQLIIAYIIRSKSHQTV